MENNGKITIESGNKKCIIDVVDSKFTVKFEPELNLEDSDSASNFITAIATFIIKGARGEK